MLRSRVNLPLGRRRCFSTSLQARHAVRFHRSDFEGYDRHVAVIGGGITGLTTAYRLSENPRTHVTLYEKSSRLGGWLQSEYLDVDGKRILFEYGPRTFRMGFPGAVATIELMQDLGLRDEMSIIKGTGARYIYHKDHLERLPGPDQGLLGNLWTFASSSFLRGLLGKILRSYSETTTSSEGSESAIDVQGDLSQSLGDYLESQLGKDFVEDFASAIIHGIYAADIYKIDARKVLPGPVYSQGKVNLLAYMLVFSRKNMYCANWDITLHQQKFFSKLGPEKIEEYINLCKSGSIFMLNRGMSRLTEKLAKRLNWADNVDVRLGRDVTSILPSSGGVKITVDDGQVAQFDHVCSTTRSDVLQKQLNGLCSSLGDQDSRTASELISDAFKNLNGAVNVMVVNLYYKEHGLTPPGFGYLIPNSVSISEQNPERALGVIFPPPDEAGQDDSSEGTKIGVMMGGHWWDDWKESDLPNEEQAIDMAKALLRRHLGIDQEPLVAKARLQRNCIPQTRSSTFSMGLLDSFLCQHFQDRLSLAGPSYGPAGLNDCIRAASLNASMILDQESSTNLSWYYTAPALAGHKKEKDGSMTFWCAPFIDSLPSSKKDR